MPCLVEPYFLSLSLSSSKVSSSLCQGNNIEARSLILRLSGVTLIPLLLKDSISSY